ncbi:DUF1266 domain-containing protein [Variovorax sp.]|uniref:DUF1266 domain-containing protein n=1 Tax=Variovorax sp. TaxID=1871043 RepID=UPI0013853ABC|nr:DUF1266 domain-containing protein [Variovorax sp.]KAF1068900.1 MAG: hypothetical protein GAK39_03104 [Variovorax sp.]
MGFLDKVRKLFSFSFNRLEDGTPLTPAQHRGLALGAVYAAESYLPINALTTESDRATAVALLASAWGVTGAGSAREVTESLLSQGHRAHYAVVNPRVERLYRGSRSDAAAVAQANLAALPGEAVARGLDLESTRDYYESWHEAAEEGLFDKLPRPLPASIMAWDMGRLVQLHRLIQDARLLRAEESWNAIASAARLAQPAYQSWRDFGDSFVVGRAFWLATHDLDRIAEDTDTFQRATAHLLSHEHSPWRQMAW